MRELVLRAAEALQQKPGSVMDKQVTPPSGDKHDYVSYATYWWPDPDQPNGLPFIRRDGVTNHEQIAKGDGERKGAMVSAVVTLTLAGYLTGDEKYSHAAARHLDVWFLDPATRMNPHLEYGQGIPGRVDGRCFGIIDTWTMVELLDAIEVLEHSGSLSQAQSRALDEWFNAYLNWLLESELGKLEQQSANNHGTWYAAQVARLALAVDRPQEAKRVLQTFRDTHLKQMFDEHGMQPHEMARTRSFDYARFNLLALANAARCGDRVGVDLWNEPRGGAGFKQGVDYLSPYLQFQKPWTHTQITDRQFSPANCRLLLLATAKFGEPGYTEFLQDKELREPGEWMQPVLTQRVPSETASN
jgi:hypothetical protein